MDNHTEDEGRGKKNGDDNTKSEERWRTTKEEEEVAQTWEENKSTEDQPTPGRYEPHPVLEGCGVLHPFIRVDAVRPPQLTQELVFLYSLHVYNYTVQPENQDKACIIIHWATWVCSYHTWLNWWFNMFKTERTQISGKMTIAYLWVSTVSQGPATGLTAIPWISFLVLQWIYLLVMQLQHLRSCAYSSCSFKI